jgi:hypothetical protein
MIVQYFMVVDINRNVSIENVKQGEYINHPPREIKQSYTTYMIMDHDFWWTKSFFLWRGMIQEDIHIRQIQAGSNLF